MTAITANLSLPDPVRRAKAAIGRAMGDPRYGWLLKAVVLYVLIVEVALQALFGRIDIPLVTIGFLEIGRKAESVPREVIANGMVSGSLYALVAMGVILVYRANRFINFAQAQLGAVPAAVALLLIAKRGWPYLSVLPIVIIGAALLGAGTEAVFIRRFSKSPRLILTVVSIGVGLLLVIAEYYAKTSVGGELIDSLAFDYRSPVSGLTWTWGVQNFNGDYVMAVIIVGAAVLGLGAFFRFTDMGIAVRASAENDERASLLGIPVKRVSTVVWALAAVLSSLGVFLRGPLTGINLTGNIGLSVLLFSLAIAVMAKMESMPMAFGAGLLIGAIDETVRFSTNRAALSNAVMFVVIVAALLIQRGALSRAMDLGASSWQVVKEYRPIPTELRSIREVVIARRALIGIVGTLALTIPWLVGDRNTGEMTTIAIYSMIGVSLVVLTGWTGQISLGQYAIAGVASAVTGGLAANHGWDFFGAVFTGGMVGAAVAVLIGLPALRIQGLFLAVTTLAFAFAVEGFVLKREFFGWMLPKDGAAIDRPVLYGAIDLSNDSKVGPVTIYADTKFYWLCLTFLALVIVLARSLRRNRSGRILIGVRDNGRFMQAFGVNLAGTRLAAFAISGFVAGIAGALLAYQNQFFSPGGFSPQGSMNLFVASVIGGVGSLPGAVLGAIYVGGLPLLPVLKDITFVEFLTSGLGLLLLLMFLPGGLIEGVYKIRDNLLRRVAAKHGIHVPSLVADSLVTDEEEGMILDEPVAALTLAPAGGGR